MVAKYATKGSHVIQAREWIDGNLGAGTFHALSVEERADWTSMLLPGSWYDAEALVRVLEKASKRTGRSVEDLGYEIARQNALSDLTTIYRVFLRVAAPVRFLGFTPTLWRNYVAFADAKVVTNEPGF